MENNERGKWMKLLYGTCNPAKIFYMRKRLEGLPIEIIGLKDLKIDIPKISEDGNTPLENAEQKARGYFQTFHRPVFSCDSGLYVEGLPDALQPGVHIRRLGGRVLSDNEMIEYYAGLAKKYGDLKASYRNAICLVLDGKHIFKAMEENMADEPFLITSRPHPVVREGFPLDSLSVDLKTGKYFYDMEQPGQDKEDGSRGFLEFFQRYMPAIMDYAGY